MVDLIKQSIPCIVAQKTREYILSNAFCNILFNDIALQIKGANTDRCLDDFKWGIILYTTNIVLLAECHLQNMLNVVSLWCYKWRLAVNQISQIMHFRIKNTREIVLAQLLYNITNINMSYVFLSMNLMRLELGSLLILPGTCICLRHNELYCRDMGLNDMSYVSRSIQHKCELIWMWNHLIKIAENRWI